jgi:hypothetical protein
VGRIPRHWKFVDAFPMTVTGKVQTFRVREAAVEELGLEKGSRDQNGLTAARLNTLGCTRFFVVMNWPRSAGGGGTGKVEEGGPAQRCGCSADAPPWGSR